MVEFAEDTIQAAVLKLLAYIYPAGFVAHVPNGGKRNKREAAKLKWQGVKPGFPDLVIVRPHKRVSWIEMKATKGTLSKEQKELHALFRMMGHQVHVVRDIDQIPPLVAQWKKEDATP